MRSDARDRRIQLSTDDILTGVIAINPNRIGSSSIAISKIFKYQTNLLAIACAEQCAILTERRWEN